MALSCCLAAYIVRFGTSVHFIYLHVITLFSLVAMKKVKYLTDWSEQTNQLAIPPAHSERKLNTMLIGQSGACELLPWNHRND